MTKLLETAFEVAKTLPDDRQDQIGKWVMDVVQQDDSAARLSPEQNAEVRRRMDAPEQPVSVEDAVTFFKNLHEANSLASFSSQRPGQHLPISR